MHWVWSPLWFQITHFALTILLEFKTWDMRFRLVTYSCNNPSTDRQLIHSSYHHFDFDLELALPYGLEFPGTGDTELVGGVRYHHWVHPCCKNFLDKMTCKPQMLQYCRMCFLVRSMRTLNILYWMCCWIRFLQYVIWIHFIRKKLFDAGFLKSNVFGPSCQIWFPLKHPWLAHLGHLRTYQSVLGILSSS